MQKKVLLIKSNIIDNDSRVTKEANALKENGYFVTLISWDRDNQTSKSRQSEAKSYNELLFKLRAPWGISILFMLPFWWCFVFYELIVNNWDIAQAINLDSIIPAVIVGKLKRKPVIYEIEDTYADQIVLPKAIRNICIRIDKLFMKIATAIILIDENQIKEFGEVPNPIIVSIYDTPDNYVNNIDILKIKNEVFTLFYSGWFNKARRMNLSKIASVVGTIDNVKLVISGRGDQSEEINNWAITNPSKIIYLGFIPDAEVIRWSYTADLLVVARTAEILGNRYNCGSTVLRALMCGKPFIANKGTATADLVLREKCGIAVDAYNTADIFNAIVRLKNNPVLCQELGDNARKAYEQKYRWTIMQNKLVVLYEELLENRNKRNIGFSRK